jgi:PAS domain S-box-containing protein
MLAQYHARRLQGDESHYQYPFRYIRKDGTVGWLEMNSSLIMWEERPAGLCLMTGITERKQAEQALHDSRDLLRVLVDSLPVGILYVDAAERIVFANKTAASWWGMPGSDPSGHAVEEIFGDHYLGIQSRVKTALAGQEVTCEEQVEYKDGITRDIVASYMTHIGVDGQVKGVACLIENISELKQVERELRESEQRLQLALKGGALGLWDWNLKTGSAVLSKRTTRMIGYERDELDPHVRTWKRAVHPDDWEQVSEALNGHLSGQIPCFEAEFRMRGKSSEWKWFQARGKVVEYDKEGKPQRITGTMLDVTQTRRAAEKLRKTQEKYRHLIENAYDIVYTTDSNGRFTFVNSAFVQHVRYPMEEVIGRNYLEFIPEEYRGDISRFYGRQFVKKLPDSYYEFPFVTKNGEIRWYSQKTQLLTEDDSIVGFQSIARDITERKQVEEALRRSEQRFRELAELLPQTVYEIDTTGKFIFINSAALKLTGYSLEEFLTTLNPVQLVIEKDRERVANNFKKIIMGQEVVVAPYTALTKDGSTVPILVYAVPISENKKIVGIRGVIVDISPLKQAEEEREKLKSQLYQSQKLEALGTLVGGIAHDFNNMLQSILGYSEMLLIGKKKNDPDYNDLQTIIETGKGAAELIKKLLAFGQQAQIIPVRLDLNQQITQICPLISRTLPQVVEVELDLADGLAPILADHNQIDQVVMNLAINASEAMPNGGRLKIATRTVSLDEEYCRRHHEVQPGAYAMLSVKDSGRGMDEETLTKIFDPFFSTKQRGAARGTGLGLAVVQGIVEQQGGHVTCESEPGIGTEFRIYFPAIDAPLTTAKTAVPVVQSGGTETILVVEDSSTVAELEQRFLASDGYTVIVAANGQEALDIYQTRKNEISLVILDLLMPEMSGRDCLMELLKIDPSVKVIIASGYSPGDELHKEISPFVKGFVHKPFAISELLNEARSVMDSD